jgi:hypothetical protein
MAPFDDGVAHFIAADNPKQERGKPDPHPCPGVIVIKLFFFVTDPIEK